MIIVISHFLASICKASLRDTTILSNHCVNNFTRPKAEQKKISNLFISYNFAGAQFFDAQSRPCFGSFSWTFNTLKSLTNEGERNWQALQGFKSTHSH